MNRALFSVILAGAGMLILTACNLPIAQNQQPSTETPLPTTVPTATPVTVTDTPSASPTPEFAPFCAPEAVSVPTPAGCQLPIAWEGDAFCNKKIPYNLVFMNPGSTYETLSESFRCSSEGLQDGKQVISCTGPMAASYEVRICDPACIVPTAGSESALCPPGYTLDEALECCAPQTQITQPNCVTLKIKTKSCVVNCAIYKKKSDCNANSYACIWNESTDTCQLRK
ncbi:MAG: hypothetical protein Fur0043_05090 [Anaerolineales bacterium]